MQHVENLELMRRAVRSQICPHCHHRPKGSEALTPREPRACEPKCAIFLNLPVLEEIASRHANEPGAYEQAIRKCVCQACTLSDSSGDFCADGLTRSCPLATYAKQVIDLLEGLLAVR